MSMKRVCDFCGRYLDEYPSNHIFIVKRDDGKELDMCRNCVMSFEVYISEKNHSAEDKKHWWQR